jgi:imidazolonepropionase-like amidohydrolase
MSRSARVVSLLLAVLTAPLLTTLSPAARPRLAAQSPAATGPLVLNNFTLIDGRGGPPLTPAALVAENGRITWIGPAAQLKAPRGAAIRELKDKFVMPGIIDLHVHVANADGLRQDPVEFFTRANVERELKLYASYGVTSVLSLGTDQPLVYRLRAEQRAGKPAMARLFTAGRGFTVVEGFPTNPGNVPGVPYEVGDVEQAAAAVEELAKNRPDVVKIWVDDRFGDFKKTPIALSRAIIDTAHKAGLKAVAHVFYLADAKQLAAAGANAFAHSVRDQSIDAELLQLMKQHGTWQIPTLTRDSTTFSWAAPDSYLADPFFTRAVPPLMLAALKTPEYRQNVRNDPHFGEYPGLLRNAQQNLKKLADAGVKIGFGTDSGPPGRVPGYLAHWEMELMVEAGLTPAQVIAAATKSSAEFLGEKELGTLERGRWADLIVLNGNPLADIRNSRSIESVYIAGARMP